MGDVMTGIEIIQSKIYTVRGVNVMLDRDLAELYQVETKRLNEQFKRNINRFGVNYAFQLTQNEWDSLRSQFATLKNQRGQHAKYLPHVFTEYGTLMLATVLNSEEAIKVNQRIIEAFVEARRMAATHPEYELLREKIKRIESEIREIKLEKQIDSKLITGKVIQLGERVQEAHGKIDGVSSVMELFSTLLDEFEKSHIIIKKPEDGLGKNQNN